MGNSPIGQIYTPASVVMYFDRFMSGRLETSSRWDLNIWDSFHIQCLVHKNSDISGVMRVHHLIRCLVEWSVWLLE